MKGLVVRKPKTWSIHHKPKPMGQSSSSTYGKRKDVRDAGKADTGVKSRICKIHCGVREATSAESQESAKQTAARFKTKQKTTGPGKRKGQVAKQTNK